ncbi:phosphoribosylamine--glycine ligase [Acidiferrimicrobium sp. IK]|nr:phosphoribosylamine--glycine ligase [Acidiferrimicrobium sp. IK]
MVGSGGREHALASALARTAEVIVAPGNAGMAALSAGEFSCVDADPEDIDADLWVVGPEAPLVNGLADRLRAQGKLVFGPGSDGARLEGSKAWMKEILASAGVPTAGYGAFDAEGPAIEYLRSLPAPWVVKTDGLAAGKGVLVTDDFDAAVADVRAKLSGAAFGAAGRQVVVEEGLVGPEVSVMAICDGVRAWPLVAARDYKRAGDGDRGPNTGGMGALSPVPGAGEDVVDAVMRSAVEPTLAALRDRGVDYRGVLYAGVMLTAAGPKILEFNVRFGDPETQVVLPRWDGDVTAVLAAAAAGRLDAAPPITWSSDAAVTVVLAAAGYPDSPRAGDAITGLDAAAAEEGVQVFTAGVGAAPDSPADASGLVTAGGRVVAVTGLGADIDAARSRAYAGVSHVDWPGLTYRHDIAAPSPAGNGPEVATPR